MRTPWLPMAWAWIAIATFGRVAEALPYGVDQAQDDEIRRLCVLHDDASGPGILQLARQLIEIFAAIGWIRRVMLTNESVGVDITNRDGLGVIIDNVYSLTSGIKRTAWDDEQVKKAACIEEIPGRTDILDFNKALVRKSAGRLPPVVESELRFGALACNHTLLGLRCIKDAMPHDDPTMTRNGRFSIDVIRETDGPFADAAEKGILWDVFHWKIRAHYPKAIPIIVSARNAPQQLFKKDTVFQVLLKIANKVRNTPDGRTPDWENIRRDVIRSAPPCSSYVDNLLFWVQSCSGGKSGWVLAWMVQLFTNNGLGGADREIEPEFWLALAKAPTKPNATPCLKSAFILDNITCQPGEMRGVLCSRMTPQTVTAIFGKKEKQAEAQECENFLRAVFNLQGEVEAAEARVARAAGAGGSKGAGGSQGAVGSQALVDDEPVVGVSEVVIAALKRTVSLFRRFQVAEKHKTLKAIGHALLRELEEYFPETAKLGNEFRAQWSEPPKEEAKDEGAQQTASSASAAAVFVEEVSASDGTSDTLSGLRRYGLDIGAHLRTKNGKAKDLWEIREVTEASPDDKNIVLRDLEHEASSVKVSLQTLIAEYGIPPAGYEKAIIRAWADWGKRKAADAQAWCHAVAIADAKEALLDAARFYPEDDSLVSVMLNLKGSPVGLQAASPAKPNEIVLVPLTPAIIIKNIEEDRIKKADKKSQSDEVEYLIEYLEGAPLEAKEWKIALMPGAFQEPKKETEKERKEKENDLAEKPMSLFWRVKTTREESKANMEIRFATVLWCGYLTEGPVPATKRVKLSGKAQVNVEENTAGCFDKRGAEASRLVKMRVPVLVNTKDLIPGDTLLQYKPETHKQADDEDKDGKSLDLEAMLHKQLAQVADARRARKGGLARRLPGATGGASASSRR